jgi:hypothetical protein
MYGSIVDSHRLAPTLSSLFFFLCVFLNVIPILYFPSRKPTTSRFQSATTKFSICKIWIWRMPSFGKRTVRTSQETHYFSTTEPSPLMLFKIWGIHSGDNEECRLLDVRLCRSCKKRPFIGTYRLHHHGDNNRRSMDSVPVNSNRITLRRHTSFLPNSSDLIVHILPLKRRYRLETRRDTLEINRLRASSILIFILMLLFLRFSL